MDPVSPYRIQAPYLPLDEVSRQTSAWRAAPLQSSATQSLEAAFEALPPSAAQPQAVIWRRMSRAVANVSARAQKVGTRAAVSAIETINPIAATIGNRIASVAGSTYEGAVGAARAGLNQLSRAGAAIETARPISRLPVLGSVLGAVDVVGAAADEMRREGSTGWSVADVAARRSSSVLLGAAAAAAGAAGGAAVGVSAAPIVLAVGAGYAGYLAGAAVYDGAKHAAAWLSYRTGINWPFSMRNIFSS